MKNFNDLIKNFFEANCVQVEAIATKVAVVRNDGIILYSNLSDELEASSIGALTGGLWQAAQALSSFVTTISPTEEFRLSFDTTNQGIYIVPFIEENKDYYLCGIYEGVDNPGLLKRNFRNLKESLITYIENNKAERTENKKDEEKGEFLFNDISDAEMDNLFFGTGL